MQIRPADLADAAAIADIYNQGIQDRVATFETRLRSAEDVASWFDGVHPIIVAEDDGKVVAFASTSNYRPRDCYQGIAEVSVYVARNDRSRAQAEPSSRRSSRLRNVRDTGSSCLVSFPKMWPAAD